MPRPKHPKPEVESALKYAERAGCEVRTAKGHGHAWGMIVCPGCRLIFAYSTPANPGNHGRDLRHQVDRCTGK